MSSITITIKTIGDCMQGTIASCNPQVPVKIEPADHGNFYLGGRAPSSKTFIIHTDGLPATESDQNPIRIDIGNITCEQGDYRGDSIALFGYFLEPNASEISFYVNETHSQQNYEYGSVGLNCSLSPNQSNPYEIIVQ